MKLYKDKPDYVRLDDDVSFQLVRTNPKLTTNTKLVYDGENLYMDSYSVTPILSTLKYKHHRVWRSGLYNRDIRNFLLGTDQTAYEVGQIADNVTILNNFDNQFENTYWCGVEAIGSHIYPQEMGCIAPLYLRKKRPNYFVIFKVDKPANTNMSIDVTDTKFDFNEDIWKHTKILKAFDLREGTPLGDYIKRYVEQKEFKYDQSIYVNFSANEIRYYGIDKSLGVLTQKVENFEDQLLNNDSPIMSDDKWITSGFERNNLIFPYILNIEFLFDDKDIEEYKFARYFGMYCNDIDLYDFSVGMCKYDDEYKDTVIRTNFGIYSYDDLNNENFHYIKDKERNIYSIVGTYVPGIYRIPGKVEEKNLIGFEEDTVSTYAERLPGVGKAFMVLEILTKLEKSETITVYNTISHETIATFVSSNQFDKGEFFENRFSCKGSVNDIAYALAGCIKNCETDDLNWVTAFSVGNKVVIEGLYGGENLNGLFDFSGTTMRTYPKRVVKLMDKFTGGTNKNNCMFKVYTDDKDVFVDEEGKYRYIKCGIGRDNAKILSVIPYVHDNTIDDTYSVVITDTMGPFVNVTKTEQIEILDVFHPKVGVLSFFPVKDFDFDTVESAYGNYTMFYNELKEFQEEKYKKDAVILEGDIVLNKQILDIVPYKRFYDEYYNDVHTEYDYYCENIIPEMSTDNKTVPYIAKWGYMDEAKDSCENPYRLNMSKIFNTCNFSANTYMQRGDISEYTHSMPYYLIRTYGENVNEYQYIPYSAEEWSNNYPSLLEYFSRTKEDGKGDPFEEMFGDVSKTEFTSKRFNRKYSRFLLGNDMVKSSTLFRGVKFEITELNNGKEVRSGKYNDYRFSFIYIPVQGMVDEEQCVHFIKNDDYKFIVGIVFFDITMNAEIEDFNKAYAYAGSMGFLDINN